MTRRHAGERHSRLRHDNGPGLVRQRRQEIICGMGELATRRLWQFRLRTMFVVTALAAAVLGWKFNFVHQRTAVMRSIEARGGRFDTRAANVSPEKRKAVINRLVNHMTSREHG